MGKREDVLAAVTVAGEKGISVVDVAKAVGYEEKSLIFPHIFRLRALGHKISFENGVYTYRGLDPVVQVKSSDHSAPEPKQHRKYKKRKVSKNHRVTKRDQLLTMLQGAGDQGILRAELAKSLDIEQKNLIFHIYSLRKRHKCKIDCVNDRYILRGGSAVDTKESEQDSDSQPTTVDLNAPVSKHIRVVKNLSPDNAENYLEYLFKAKFYYGCAESVVRASQTISQIKKEAQSAL